MNIDDYQHPSDYDKFSTLKEEDTILTQHKLINLRSRQFPDGHTIHLHYHDTLEIDISKNTVGTIHIEGIKTAIFPGSVVVIPPGILHSYRFQPNSRDFEVLHISMEAFSRYIHKEMVFGLFDTGIQNIAWTHKSYSAIIPLVDELSTLEMTDVLSILSVILKICSYMTKTIENHQNYQRLNKRIRRVIEFTEENYQRPLSLEDAANTAGLSRYYFSRTFKTYTGSPYSLYLTQVRLSHAKHLLLRGHQVTESCLESGFENLSYFIEIFKRYNHGISPGKYQRKYLSCQNDQDAESKKSKV